MSRGRWVFVVMAAALVASGCAPFTIEGSGEVVAETREASGFDAIEASGIAEVTVVLDGTESVRIEAEDNLIDRLTSEVSAGTLVLGTEPGSPISPTEPIRIEVHARSLERVLLSGAGSVSFDRIETSDLELEVSGVGEVTGHVAVDRLDVELSGAGSVVVSGTADVLALDVSGVGSFRGQKLEASKASVEMSGAGSAEVSVIDALDVDVSGAGEVTYFGDPDVRIESSGVGDVVRG